MEKIRSNPYLWGYGGIGRHEGLKIQWAKAREGSTPSRPTKTDSMSIYATNITVNEETGESELIKRLNKIKVNRGTYNRRAKGWNKSGKKGRDGRNLIKIKVRKENKIDIKSID